MAEFLHSAKTSSLVKLAGLCAYQYLMVVRDHAFAVTVAR